VGVVLFNKFVLGKAYHMIVDMELISTKSRFNVAFAQKLTFALFMNTAMISYLCDILISHNYVGPGGFIDSESWMFVWNAIIPPFVWFSDPWTIKKNYDRKKEHEKALKGECYLTQKEVHNLVEQVEYTQGKRYADIMKTMWFTFFYTSCIPLGTLLSIVSLSLYYWVDKYNVTHRRTIKESLSMDVTLEMIELLEMCIIWFAIGNITFQWQLFHIVSYTGIAYMALGLIYILSPMQEINEWLFVIDNEDENEKYDIAKYQFNTDYDRENPVLKHEALKEWNKEFFMRNRDKMQQALKQHHEAEVKLHPGQTPLLNVQEDIVHMIRQH